MPSCSADLFHFPALPSKADQTNSASTPANIKHLLPGPTGGGGVRTYLQINLGIVFYQHLDAVAMLCVQ